MLAAGFMAGTMMAQTPLEGYNAPTYPKEGNVGNIVSFSTSGALEDLTNISIPKTPSGKITQEISVAPGAKVEFTININTFWGQFMAYSDANETKTMQRLILCGNSGTTAFENHTTGVTVYVEDGATKVDSGTLPSVTIPSGASDGDFYLLRMMFIGGTDSDNGYDGAYAEGTYYDVKINVKSQIEKYAVNINTPENGSLTVMNGNTAITSGDEIAEGVVLTIEATPNDGYELKQITLNGTEYKATSLTVTEAVTLAAEFTELPADGNGWLLKKGEATLRIPDEIIGTHVANQPNQDSRVRNYTLSAWISPMGYNGWFMGHMQRTIWEAQGSYAVGVQEGKLAVSFRKWSAEDSGDCPDGGIVVSESTTLNPQEYAFVTFVSDHDNKSFRVYKNGELALEKTNIDGAGLALLFDETCDFFFGDNRQQLISSKVEEAQIWTKSLTAEEIKESMFGSYTDTDKPDGLAGYYVMGDAVTVDNLVGDNYDGVLRKNGALADNVFPAADAVVKTNGRPEVSLTVNVEGGTVDAPETAKQYSIATLTVTPDQNMELESVVVDGESMDITDITQEDGVYIVPVKIEATDVTVQIVLESKPVSGLENISVNRVCFVAGCLHIGENAQAYVFNATGTLVANTTEAVTDLSYLPAGVYIVKVRQAGQSTEYRFIK